MPTIDSNYAPKADTTKPVIVPVDVAANTLYPLSVMPVSFKIKESRGLESVKIYLDDKEVEYVAEGETYTFVIPSSGDERTVKVVAVDKAGNEASMKIENVIVSDSFFVRFINDTTYMITTIVTVIVVILAAFGLFVLIKKIIKYRKGV